MKDGRHAGYNKDSQYEPKWRSYDWLQSIGKYTKLPKYTKDGILRNDIILSTKYVLLNHYRIIPA